MKCPQKCMYGRRCARYDIECESYYNKQPSQPAPSARSPARSPARPSSCGPMKDSRTNCQLLSRRSSADMLVYYEIPKRNMFVMILLLRTPESAFLLVSSLFCALDDVTYFCDSLLAGEVTALLSRYRQQCSTPRFLVENMIICFSIMETASG